MRTVVLSQDHIIQYLNDNFINTWVANADLGRTGSLQDPIAKRREREDITFDTSHILAKVIKKGWAKGSPVDCFVISPDFDLMGSLDYNEFLDNLGRRHDDEAYQLFLQDSLEGKRPGLGDIILTPEQPSQEVIDTIHTPKMAHQDYTVIGINTTAFEDGGTLTIDIQVGRDDAIGIFHLLDGDRKIPNENVPDGIDPNEWYKQRSKASEKALGALVTYWGIFPGKNGKLKYDFDKGQLFKLCATGDQWGGVGGINAFVAKITVEDIKAESSEVIVTEDIEENQTPVSSELNVVLNREQPSQEVLDIFRAPGEEYQDYTVVNIDATAFESGGILTIDIKVGSAEPYGSFDLFDGDTILPTEGIPNEALDSAWEIEPDGTETITYRFEQGKVFKFGATGDWFSEKGDINAFTAIFSVEEN